MATTKAALIANFKRLNLQQPILHQGLVRRHASRTVAGQIALRIWMAAYTSVKLSLEYAYPRLANGALLSDKPEKVALL